MLSGRSMLCSRIEDPFICLKPIDGKFDRFTDAQSRRPAKSTNAACIEINEGNIADPAAIAAGIGEARGKTQPVGDPTGGILDFAIFVSAEIEDVNLSIGAFDCRQHGFNTISNLKIGFTLQPVAENVQDGGILREFPHKIEYVPMRVALAKDRNEAKNIAAHSEAFSVGGDQTLARQL